MGMYLNAINGQQLPTRGKVEAIIQLLEGGKKISPPIQWEEGLVCVVNNGGFEAAAYAFDEGEMQVFLNHLNGRPSQWLLVPNAKEHAR